MITSRKVDFAFPPKDLPLADSSARAAADRGDPQTLQTCLLQFPAATRLDMDLGCYNLGRSDFKSVLGDHTTQLSSTTIESLSHQGSQHITELVLNRYHSHLVYLAVAMPSPSLERLHISLESSHTGFTHSAYLEDYLHFFDRWGDATAIWRSLKKVEVCITVTLPYKEYLGDGVGDPQRHGIWNFWVSRVPFSGSPYRSRFYPGNLPHPSLPRLPLFTRLRNQPLHHLQTRNGPARFLSALSRTCSERTRFGTKWYRRPKPRSGNTSISQVQSLRLTCPSVILKITT
jgi:hypothetical protein